MKIQITQKEIKINIKFSYKNFSITFPNDKNLSDETVSYKIIEKISKKKL